jgi:hypothetical protein
LPDASDATLRAEEIVPDGDALTAVPLEEDGFRLWRVDVAMPNGAHLEMVLFESDGLLYKIEDHDGPFDYALDPLPGQLTYEDAVEVATSAVAGPVIAWKVKWTGGSYFCEVYVRDESAQLWEIKLWADTGEIYAMEEKDAVD